MIGYIFTRLNKRLSGHVSIGNPTILRGSENMTGLVPFRATKNKKNKKGSLFSESRTPRDDILDSADENAHNTKKFARLVSTVHPLYIARQTV